MPIYIYTGGRYSKRFGVREDNHDLDVKIFGTHGSTWCSMNHVI